MCAVSVASWRLFTAVAAWCFVFAVSLASRGIFTGVRNRCVVCAVSSGPWRLFTAVRGWCVCCTLFFALALVYWYASVVCCLCFVRGHWAQCRYWVHSSPPFLPWSPSNVILSQHLSRAPCFSTTTDSPLASFDVILTLSRRYNILTPSRSHPDAVLTHPDAS